LFFILLLSVMYYAPSSEDLKNDNLYCFICASLLYQLRAHLWD